MDLASTLPSTCARPARALFYHLSRRSRAHDRCSVGERGWEGGGRCTLSRRELVTRGGKGSQRRQGEGRQKGQNGRERRRVSSRLTSTRPSIPPRIPVHYRPYPRSIASTARASPLLSRGRLGQLITLLTANLCETRIG